MAVLIMGLSDIGFCVFSLGSICVGLIFWIRVVVGFLMFVYFLFDVFHFHLVCVSGGIVVGVSGLFCGWLVDFCVEFCVYLF